MVGGGSVDDVLWGSLFSGVSFRVIPSPKANANGLHSSFPTSTVSSSISFLLTLASQSYEAGQKLGEGTGSQ